MAGGSWKVAYADFVTALMAFFLLMWILAMVPPEKRAEMAGYFNDPGGYQSRSQIIDYSSPPPIGVETLEKDLTPTEMEHLAINRFLRGLLGEQIQEDQIRLQPSEAGVMLRTSNAMLFERNEAEFDKEEEAMLDAVIATMRRFKVHLYVSGHTDSAETGAPNYSDKWELSAARASAATAYIVEKGKIDPSLILSVARANYRPIVPDTLENPNHVNSRVEFFFYSPDTRPTNLGFD